VNRGLSVVFAIALLGLAGPAAAQTLESAQQHYLEAEFERAGAELDAVLERSDLDAATAVEAHRLLAALHLIFEDRAQAREHADAALALDPATTAPDGAPLELTEIFGQARSATAGRRPLLEVRAEGWLHADRPGRVLALLSPAPPRLVPELRLRCLHGGSVLAHEEGPPPEVGLEVTPPQGARAVTCEAQAATAGGAVLFETSVELTVGVPWWPWVVGAGAVVVTVAILVGVLVGTRDEGVGNGPVRLGVPEVLGW